MEWGMGTGTGNHESGIGNENREWKREWKQGMGTGNGEWKRGMGTGNGEQGVGNRNGE